MVALWVGHIVYNPFRHEVDRMVVAIDKPRNDKLAAITKYPFRQKGVRDLIAFAHGHQTSTFHRNST
ncbi:hypothetical protein AB4144_32920, partial [Rhizobiaceae sp. 2RAB30]